MRKHTGFTLAELLVALACSAVVLWGVMTTFGIIATLQNRAVSAAEATYQLPVLRDYICQNNITEDVFIIRNGTVAHNSMVIAEGSNVTSITFSDVSINGVSYTLCCISEGNRNYEFLVIPTT